MSDKTKDASQEDVTSPTEEAAEVEEKGTKGQQQRDMDKMGFHGDEGRDQVNEDKLGVAFTSIADLNSKKAILKAARETELEKVVISQGDVDLLMSEMDLSLVQAERALRESNGDVEATLQKLIAA